MLSQLDRLEKDSAQLELFINELTKKGDHMRAQKIMDKKAYLDNRLEEIRVT